MKRILPITIVLAYLICLAFAAHAVPPPPVPEETRTITVVLPSPDVLEPTFQVALLKGTVVSGVTNWVEIARQPEQLTNTFTVAVGDRTKTAFFTAQEIDPDPVGGSVGNPSGSASIKRRPLSDGWTLKIQ